MFIKYNVFYKKGFIMLTKRQLEILKYFIKNHDKTINKDTLTSIFSIGKRSISNDVKAINQYLNDEYNVGILNIDSRNIGFNPSKSRIQEIEIDVNNQLHRIQFSDVSYRVDWILVKLLNANHYIKSMDLIEELYISESRLSKDLKIVRSIIEKYELELQSRPHYGLKLLGNEQEKRRLIINENLISLFSSENYNYTNKNINYINSALTDCLVKYKFKVSDLIYQNLIVHIYIALDRIKKGHCLDKTDKLPSEYHHAYQIAYDIFSTINKHEAISCPDEEIKAFAIKLQSNQEYDTDEYIDQEMEKTVFDILKVIKTKFEIDFTNDMNLRVALALHTRPLLSRLTSKRPLRNGMTYEIKQNNAYAFDIASEYAYQLCKKYQVEIIDDEIAYLALHFIMYMETKIGSNNSKKILIVSSQRKTNTLLLRLKLQQWFNNDLNIICINPSEFNNVIDKNDCLILTTEKEFLNTYSDVILIDLFPSENDYYKVELALNRLLKLDQLINYFHKSLFFSGDVDSKEEMLSILCNKVEKINCTGGQLLNSVLDHEQKVSSYFGNQFAMPHPDAPLTNKTYICVGIPKKPLKWSDEETTKIVFLICIEKNSTKEKVLQIWKYLSFLIKDPNQINTIIKNPTYDNFIKSVYLFYHHMFK